MRPTWFQNEPSPRRPAFSLRMPGTIVGLLILANVLVFLLQNITRSLEGVDLLIPYLALHCRDLLGATFFLSFYQLVTYQFLHAGFLHIFVNMLILFFFGRELESLLGSRRFLFLYLAGGAAGGVAFVALSAFSAGAPTVIGASGAVFGILVYYALMWPRRTVNVFLFPFMIPMQVMFLALIMIGAELFYGIFSSGDGVAHFCHLGGALFGYLFFRFERRWREMAAWAGERKRRFEGESDGKREIEMDRLLKKIHEKGLGSLTSSERSFLNEASRRIRRRR